MNENVRENALHNMTGAVPGYVISLFAEFLGIDVLASEAESVSVAGKSDCL